MKIAFRDVIVSVAPRSGSSSTLKFVEDMGLPTNGWVSTFNDYENELKDYDLKICIYRDPVERFLSLCNTFCKKDPVAALKLSRRSMGFTGAYEHYTQKNGPQFLPMHFTSQFQHNGDPSNYDFTFNVKDFQSFADVVNERYGTSIPAKRIRWSKYEIKLTPEQVEEVKEIYKDDYIYFK